MERYIYNEKNGLWYELQGDYYLPCLKLLKEETAHIGIFGQRHRRYLKTHRKALYSSLLTSGKLNGYLADINRQAEDMYSRLVKQMAE
ncbi:MAG: TnpV protein, partial [Firmicutes bacterium]|nr:TnpV protein [Bacillota bacterium]